MSTDVYKYMCVCMIVCRCMHVYVRLRIDVLEVSECRQAMVIDYKRATKFCLRENDLGVKPLYARATGNPWNQS